MGKKKALKALDEFELDYVNSKLSGKESAYDYMDPGGPVSAKVLKALNYKIEVKCKNQKQKEFLKALKNKKHQICFASGSAGAGKSYISLAYALQELKDGRKQLR